MEKVNNRKIPKIIMILGLIIILVGVVLMVVSKNKNLESENNENEEIEEVEESNDDTTTDENNTTTDEDNSSDEFNVCNVTANDLKQSTDSSTLLTGVNYYYLNASVDTSIYEEAVYKNGSLLVSNMTDDMKFTIAVKLVNYNGSSIDSCYEYDSENNTYGYISEEVIEKAFEITFGSGVYKQVDKVTIGCIEYQYNASDKKYYALSGGCGGESGPGIYEYVISENTTSDTYTFTTAIIVATEDGSTYYKDYEKTLKIDGNEFSNYTTEEDGYTSVDYEKYIKDNYANLEQYTYTFKIVDGNYNYQGVTRTHSVK